MRSLQFWDKSWWKSGKKPREMGGTPPTGGGGLIVLFNVKDFFKRCPFFLQNNLIKETMNMDNSKPFWAFDQTWLNVFFLVQGSFMLLDKPNTNFL